MNRSGFAALCGSVLGLLAATSEAQAVSDVIFCNHTGSKVFIAIAHIPESTKKWTLSTWHANDPGQCNSVGKLRTGLFYYYAEKEGRKLHWPAAAYVDKTFCVPDGKISREMTGGTCATGERNVGFRGLTPSAGKYTFTLN